MFVRIKRINGHDYRYLVETYRENGRVRQRVIRYLGKIDPSGTSTGTILPKLKVNPPLINRDTHVGHSIEPRGIDNSRESWGITGKDLLSGIPLKKLFAKFKKNFTAADNDGTTTA